MKISLILLLLTFVISCYCEEKNETSSLLSVVVVFRHGERNIIQTYASDPYADESYWKGGFGQLTNEGKMRHYLLGQWFRRRYDGFLPEEYSRKYVRADSTDVDRTLMSASAHLAGLFIPNKNQFDESLKWQPIPVHTIPKDEDYLVAGEKHCDLYELLYRNIIDEAPELEEDRKEMKEVFKHINKHSGSNLSTFEDVLYMYDVLTVETSKGYKLPEWTKEVYPERLTKLVGTRFSLETYNLFMAKLKVGPLFHEIITHFDNITNGRRDKDNNTYPNYRIFSGHDFTIANILNTIGSFENKVPPPYGSAVILELRNFNVNNTKFINVLYKNSSDAEPAKIKMADCDFNCHFEKFTENVKEIPIDFKTWLKACKIKSPDYISPEKRVVSIRTWVKKEFGIESY